MIAHRFRGRNRSLPKIAGSGILGLLLVLLDHLRGQIERTRHLISTAIGLLMKILPDFSSRTPPRDDEVRQGESSSGQVQNSIEGSVHQLLVRIPAKWNYFAERIRAKSTCWSKSLPPMCSTLARFALIDRIAKFDICSFFTVLGSESRGRIGSRIIFKGMQSYDSENIKSLKGYAAPATRKRRTCPKPPCAC